MKQMIQVDALGRPMGEYREDNPVSLAVIGAQTIKRFSVIHHDETTQTFYIEFRETAPADWLGQHADAGHFAGVALDVGYATIPAPEKAGQCVLGFHSYADAVKAERLLIATLMLRGAIHA